MNTEALDTLNDYIDRLRDTCRECEHPICLQHIKSFKQYVDSECLNARVDENLACSQIMATYWKTSEMIAKASERRKELNTGGIKDE